MAVFHALVRCLSSFKPGGVDQPEQREPGVGSGQPTAGVWRSHDGRPLPLLDPDFTPLSATASPRPTAPDAGRPLDLALPPLSVTPEGTPRIQLLDAADLLEPTRERAHGRTRALDEAAAAPTDPGTHPVSPIIELRMKKPGTRIQQRTLPMWRIPDALRNQARALADPAASEPEAVIVLDTPKRKERPRKPVIQSPIRRASSRHEQREALAQVLAMAMPRTRPGFTPMPRFPRPAT